MDNEPNYYAVIPATVRYSDKLSPNAKLLYGEITALANKSGYCWATNKYFSDLYKVHVGTISQLIGQLKDAGFITYSVEENYKRKIYITPISLPKKSIVVSAFHDTPLHKNIQGDTQKAEHNITSNTKINKKKAIAFSPYGKKGSDEAIILKHESDRMIQDEVEKGKRAHAIIGEFISYKMPTLKNNIRTKGQLYEFWQRHIKVANKLKVFDDEQLDRAYSKAENEYKDIEWTLETLLKYLTK